jgi:outer membrane protein TolC
VSEFAITPPVGPKLVVYPDSPDNLFTRVGFQWPIYTWGRTDALEHAAEAEALAVAADLDTARADLRFEIVRTYWAVATAREAVRVLEDSLARGDAQVRDARERFNVGLIPPNDVLGLEAQRSRERAQLIEARNLAESTLVDLRRLIGADPEAPIDLAEALDAGSPGPTASPGSTGAAAAVQEALQLRPERKALTFRIEGAAAREDVARAGAKPVLAAGGGADWANPNSRIFPRQDAWLNSWDLGVNVSWAVFDGGRTKAQVAEAKAASDAVRERLNEFDTIVSADVRQRMLDVDSTLARVEAASDAVRSASEARRVVGDRYAAGVATSTDVLVAQDALLQAALERTRALAGVKLAEARLQRVTGRR